MNDLRNMDSMEKDSDLFARVCDFENIHRAYRRASAGKRCKRDVLAFSARLEENLLSIRDDLRGGTYTHGGYRQFIVHDSKRRSIMAAPFRDRVMHHALYAVIEPMFEKGFIHDSYACRREKGTHAAVARLKRFMRRSPYADTYILQGDISKYFDSIDHATLYGIITRKLSDVRVLALIREILASAHADAGCGIPIGNLTSQLFANIYLNELDQYAKHVLRATRYIRYMDDFLILDVDKRTLAAHREAIAEFVSQRLGITLHPRKSTIAPIRLGVDFLGYRIFERHMRLRASTVRRFAARTRASLRCVSPGTPEHEAFAASVMSWEAYAAHADSFRLREDLRARLGLSLSSASAAPGNARSNLPSGI